MWDITHLIRMYRIKSRKEICRFDGYLYSLCFHRLRLRGQNSFHNIKLLAWRSSYVCCVMLSTIDKLYYILFTFWLNELQCDHNESITLNAAHNINCTYKCELLNCWIAKPKIRTLYVQVDVSSRNSTNLYFSSVHLIFSSNISFL